MLMPKANGSYKAVEGDARVSEAVSTNGHYNGSSTLDMELLATIVLQGSAVEPGTT
ncbi:hypothetical protein M6B38_313070 [Iris pallida]|uniref:Uncharacterized protein n=1 Tax=Iris pallida TaxID=29817 RepID=A0AAX6HHK9_IRIPA|nr:hypothetical protein M6B38_313070 [Iris pallida]